MINRHLKGTLLIGLAAFLWGINGTTAKMMFNTDIQPIELSTMRMSLAAVILFIYLGLTHQELLKMKKRDFKSIAILCIVGVAILQLCYYTAMARLNVSLGIFMEYLSPIIIVIFCTIAYKERMTKERAIALIFAMSGSYFIIFGGGAMGVKLNVVGVVAGLASAVCSAFYSIYGKRCTARFHPFTILAYGLGAGAILFSFICPPWKVWANRTSYELLFVGFIALFGTVIPYGLYLAGIRFLSATSASIISMGETVVASLSAYLLLGEYMSPKQIMGAALIICAILVLQVGSGLIEKLKQKKLEKMV